MTTTPGFTMSSGKYSLMFMTANASGIEGLELKTTRDWTQLMDIILELANRAGDDFDKVKSNLEDYIRAGKIMFEATPQSRVNIFNEPFFPRPKGHMKRVTISLLDHNNIFFQFSLARRNTLKTLKDIALNVVTNNVRNRLMMKKMDIPDTLRRTIKREFYNDWARKRFPSYNITVSPHAESLKRKKGNIKDGRKRIQA